MAGLKRTNLSEIVYQELLGQISDGKLMQGSSIVINRIAKEFNVSLNPIREALAKLEAEGIVQYEQNKGYRVATKLSKSEYEKLFEARIILETGVVSRGISNVPEDFVQEIEAINAKVAKCRTGKTFRCFKDFVAVNDEFHIKLISLLGNPALERAYKSIGYSPQSARDLFAGGFTEEHLKATVQEHDEIIAALKSGKRKAAVDAVENHIMLGYARSMER